MFTSQEIASLGVLAVISAILPLTSALASSMFSDIYIDARLMTHKTVMLLCAFSNPLRIFLNTNIDRSIPVASRKSGPQGSSLFFTGDALNPHKLLGKWKHALLIDLV